MSPKKLNDTAFTRYQFFEGRDLAPFFHCYLLGILISAWHIIVVNICWVSVVLRYGSRDFSTKSRTLSFFVPNLSEYGDWELSTFPVRQRNLRVAAVT